MNYKILQRNKVLEDKRQINKESIKTTKEEHIAYKGMTNRLTDDFSSKQHMPQTFESDVEETIIQN